MTTTDGMEMLKQFFANRICSELWGRPVAEILGKSDEDLFDDSEEIRIFRETAWRAVESEGWHEAIQPFTGADGQKRIGRFFRRCFHLSDGRRWLFCVVMDITNEFSHRTRLEATLQALEFDLPHLAMFHLDIPNRLITGSKNISEIWPVVGGRALKPKEVVHRDDLEKFIAVHNELLSGKVEKIQLDYSSEYFRELRYYRMEARLDHVTDDKTMMIGIIQDVTEEKKWKKQRWEAGMLQNIVVNSFGAAVFIKNASDEFRYIMANNAFGELCNTSPEQIVGKNDAALFQNNQAEIFRRNDEAICSSVEGQQKMLETIVGMDGQVRVFRVEKKCFPGANDDEQFLLGVVHDITEQTERSENQNAQLLALIERTPLPTADFHRTVTEWRKAVLKWSKMPEWLGCPELLLRRLPNMISELELLEKEFRDWQEVIHHYQECDEESVKNVENNDRIAETVRKLQQFKGVRDRLSRHLPWAIGDFRPI